MEKVEPLGIASDKSKIAFSVEKSWAFPQKVKFTIGASKELKARTQTDSYTSMAITALFTFAQVCTDKCILFRLKKRTF